MRRRDLIQGIAAIAVWPLAARAQPSPAPVVGFLGSASASSFAPMVAAFQDGLNQLGYVDGRNVTVEYHWAEGNYDQLPWFATDLVDRKVAAIVSAGAPTALAAKNATTTIPIVFLSGVDPVRVGIIRTLNRPGGNITGIAILTNGLIAKQIELLHQVLPSATLIAVLVNRETQATSKKFPIRETLELLLGLKLRSLKRALCEI